jgi:DNA polymerase I-like protein with 3'-5' exonuclease and polymerase domains
LLKVLQQGDEININIVSDIFCIKLWEIIDIVGYNDKIINFGLIYGMTAFDLVKRIGM